MNAKITKIDARRPSESFGKTFTDYLKQLPSDTAQVGGTVMDHIWCPPWKNRHSRPAPVHLLAGRALSAGNDWESNIQYVEGIF